jgi:MSHA biogenesis protein MshP
MFPSSRLSSCCGETQPLRRSDRRLQCGFGLVSAIFLVVVLASLAAALLTVTSLQHAAASLDVQGARVYQAARAGAAWGMYRVLNPDAGPSAELPTCWAGAATVTLGGSLSPFIVTATCAQTSTTELDHDVRVYAILATATFGTPRQPGFVSRHVSVTVSRCANPTNGPTFEC